MATFHVSYINGNKEGSLEINQVLASSPAHAVAQLEHAHEHNIEVINVSTLGAYFLQLETLAGDMQFIRTDLITEITFTDKGASFIIFDGRKSTSVHTNDQATLINLAYHAGLSTQMVRQLIGRN